MIATARLRLAAVRSYGGPRTRFRTLTLSVEGFVVATSGLDNTLDAISLEVEEGLAVI